MSKLKLNYLLARGYIVTKTEPFRDTDFGTKYTDVYLRKKNRIATTCISGTWSLSELAPKERK